MQLDIHETDTTVSIHPRNSPPHRDAERSLLASGVSIPLRHRTEWACVRPELEGMSFVIADRSTGRPLDIFCSELWRSRKIPGYSVVRVERFGELTDERAVRSAVGALAGSVPRIPRVLHLRVEVYGLAPARRTFVESVLEQHGFQREDDPRNYEETGLIDLTPTLDEVFAGVHKTCRRNVRAVKKNPTEIRPVLDGRLAGRLEALCSESYARTGGVPTPWDWGAIIRFSSDHPALSRIAGLFQTDPSEAEADNLIAFDWGIHHGDHGEVVTGAATRHSGLKMPLAYGTCWDLISWAKEHGACTFDLGGITRTGASDADPLGGISDFKRYFNPTIRTVGSEYSMDGSRVLSPLSRILARAADLLRRP